MSVSLSSIPLSTAKLWSKRLRRALADAPSLMKCQDLVARMLNHAHWQAYLDQVKEADVAQQGLPVHRNLFELFLPHSVEDQCRVALDEWTSPDHAARLMVAFGEPGAGLRTWAAAMIAATIGMKRAERVAIVGHPLVRGGPVLSRHANLADALSTGPDLLVLHDPEALAHPFSRDALIDEALATGLPTLVLLRSDGWAWLEAFVKTHAVSKQWPMPILYEQRALPALCDRCGSAWPFHLDDPAPSPEIDWSVTGQVGPRRSAEQGGVDFFRSLGFWQARGTRRGLGCEECDRGVMKELDEVDGLMHRVTLGEVAFAYLLNEVVTEYPKESQRTSIKAVWQKRREAWRHADWTLGMAARDEYEKALGDTMVAQAWRRVAEGWLDVHDVETMFGPPKQAQAQHKVNCSWSPPF